MSTFFRRISEARRRRAELAEEITRLRQKMQRIAGRYRNYKKSTGGWWAEHDNIRTLILMLNSDTELGALVAHSGVDEIREISPGSKRYCRVTLHYTSELGVHRRLWNKFGDGRDEVMCIVYKDAGGSYGDSRYQDLPSDTSQYVEDLSENIEKIRGRFEAALTDFFGRIGLEMERKLLQNTSGRPRAHRHAFRQVHFRHFPKGRFGESFEPLKESEGAGRARFIQDAPAGVAGAVALAEPTLKFEYATYRHFYECSCGAEHLEEDTGLI